MVRLPGQLDFLAELLQPALRLVTPAPKVPAERDGIQIQYSRRMKKGWRFEYRKWLGSGSLTLPAWMEPEDASSIRTMVLQWAKSSLGRQTQQKKELRRNLEKQIWQATAEHFALLGSLDPTERMREVRIEPQGQVHNLQASFQRVNQQYFAGRLSCRITWSARTGGLSFHSIRRSREGESYHLISISRGYDFPNCPEWALDGVVYHECLHADMGVEERDGRRLVHPPEFRLRERKYQRYREWVQWHRTVLPRNVALLRGSYLRKRRRLR